ncbi:hypothetical protein F503_01379 [Ophiostoma piceae UAMH 11346]|uniref:Uncharacterized protein n=1 Tax=Ophiostoma piceae (strain UAMH 11346) TaxID=1262450 RepID=S3CUI4_OPHP1|nr:hypothetical protein F503_01379 [Ophiostoma piceae UAMH 11346]
MLQEDGPVSRHQHRHCCQLTLNPGIVWTVGLFTDPTAAHSDGSTKITLSLSSEWKEPEWCFTNDSAAAQSKKEARRHEFR